MEMVEIFGMVEGLFLFGAVFFSSIKKWLKSIVVWLKHKHLTILNFLASERCLSERTSERHLFFFS